MTRSLFPLLLVLPALAFVPAAPAQPPQAAPVLVELFTSQSCSSCPPADAYLGVLAQRSGVLALSFHVDYWNDLGWVDRYSAPAFTQRQRDYARLLEAHVYTPQVVVDGEREMVGSDRASVEDAIQRSRRQPHLGLELARSGASIRLHWSDPDGVLAHGRSQLLLITFDPERVQAIGGGENGGRTVAYHNVVRSLRPLQDFDPASGAAEAQLQPAESGARVAAVIQSASGRVYGAAASP